MPPKKPIEFLRSALEKARTWQVTVKNVASMVDGPRIDKVHRKALTIDEILQFLEIAKQSRNYRLYLFAIHTGMRQGEILGLRWPDINFDNNIVSVQWKLSKPGLNPVFEPVKTQKSTRPIRLSETLKAKLKKHQKEQVAEKAAMGDKYEDHNLVFCQTNGRPIDGTALTYKEFKSLLEKAKLPKTIRFHDLRHSFATLLLAEGEHPKVVQEMLGHSSIGITLDIYSHVIPNLQRGAVAKLDKKLSKQTEKEPKKFTKKYKIIKRV